MSSTLYFRKTPKAPAEFGSFSQPLKGVFARRFYDHDGSLGGDLITLELRHLEWVCGVRDSGVGDRGDRKTLDMIIEALKSGETVDMWFEC
jgi:hypothetical protein